MSDSEQISLFDLEQTPPPQPKPEVAIAPESTVSSVSAAIYANLDELKAEAITCQKCPLAATRINVVVERGNRDAKVMIIGEAPGQNEDEQGLPFVGRAGQLLDKILESVGFDSSNVYICNINKCRPPGNRVPTDEEVAACKPYLLEQIRLVDPKIILLTGATAVKAITGDKRGITKIRGQWMQWEGRLVMPILHPAYLLRNPSREEGSPKWLMWQDIQVAKAKYLEFIAESPSIEEEEEF
jgi:uracil-DNA glycosylase